MAPATRRGLRGCWLGGEECLRREASRAASDSPRKNYLASYYSTRLLGGRRCHIIPSAGCLLDDDLKAYGGENTQKKINYIKTWVAARR